MGIQVYAHTSFLGNTGYNAHSQNFFTSLNKFIPTRIRNYTYTDNLKAVPKEQLDMIVEQDWQDPPYKIGRSFTPNKNDTLVNIVLNESHHYYFYDHYESPMIAYNVWESTRQLPEFFNRILEYDQFWCPTEWQAQCTIDQGYPADRVRVVPEGVDGTIFKPSLDNNIRKELYSKYNIPENAFTFMIFGRWDYRKSVKEMVETFHNTFKDYENVYLVISADNNFSKDRRTTEEKIKDMGIDDDRIRVLHFPPRNEYINWLRHGNCYVSCSRSEGWNLPLIEALACGTPSICSNWGGQLEFADAVAYLVDVPNTKPPKEVFMLGDDHDLGVWGEPDFENLADMMSYVYNTYNDRKAETLKLSRFIRSSYTWENAALTAKKYIEELVNTVKIDVPIEVEDYEVIPEEEKIKLNLGCGNDIRKGYINIDKYNNTGLVDFKFDLGDLSYFDDESVDEIFTAHVFEHISINDIYAVVNEWKRVLRPGGKLVLYLPNLEHEVKIWLESPDEDKFLNVHRIFGGQTHPGNAHYCGFNPGSLKSFLEGFNFRVISCDIGERGFGPEIQCTAIRQKKEPQYKTDYTIHFVDGPFAQINGDNNDKSFHQIDFLDPDNESHVHQATLRVNCWTRPHRKWFTNWLVKIRKNGVHVLEHKFDLQNKRVMISMDSKSLGDTIAWVPYVEEFRKKYNCQVFVSTFWNQLFAGHDYYKNVMFVQPGTVINDLYATYKIGCYDGDWNKNRNNWRTIPLQQVASDTLGLVYDELPSPIGVKPGERTINENYVTLSEHSTFQCKYWNYPNGWQTVVDWFNDNGYRVAVISKEETHLKNVINRTNRPIEETITTIYHSNLFLGISAGPSWLAWALNVPVVMISGYSHAFGEFDRNNIRIINEDVCHGCFNETDNFFDRGDWHWCPHHKGTPRQFECTKLITPEYVIDKIQKHESWWV
jgi:autotransporter strand-loop-strand O-heptosyltransferase